MGEALKEIKLPDSKDILVEEPPIIPPTHVHLQTLKPIFRVSPHVSGSTLYDSYELRAVTNQLNQAMQGYNGSPNLLSFLKSPFYSQRLDRIYRQNSKSPKGITYPKLAHVSFDRKASTTGTKSASGSLVSRLWQKVKKGLSRTKQTSKGLITLSKDPPRLLGLLSDGATATASNVHMPFRP